MPRKSYRDYQADIYPDTAGPVAAMGPLDWLEGAAVPVPRISLNPAHRQTSAGSLVKNGPTLADLPRKMLGKSAHNPAPAVAAAAVNGQVNGTGNYGRKLSSGSGSNNNNQHQSANIDPVPSAESTKSSKEVETKKSEESTSAESSRLV